MLPTLKKSKFLYIRGHDYRAGFFLGLALLKFPIVLPFALICFLRSKWKLMTGFGAAALLLAGVSLVAVGPHGILAYVHVLSDALRNNATPAFAQITRDLPTLRGFLATIMAPWAGPKWIETAAAIATTIMILVTASLWRRHDRLRRGGESGLMFAAALVVSLITSPYALTHDLSLMLIAILLVLGSQGWTSKSSVVRVLAVCIGILYTPPIYVWLLNRHIASLLFPVLLCFALAVLFLAVGCLRSSSGPKPGQCEYLVNSP